MKTKEELTALKNEVETVSKKLNKLTAEELEQVTGGVVGHCAKPEFYLNNYNACPFRRTTTDCPRCAFASNDHKYPTDPDVANE